MNELAAYLQEQQRRTNRLWSQSLHPWRNGALLTNSANQSINNTTTTALTFDTEVYDLTGLHSTSVNTDRITITTPGYYAAWAGVQWAANVTGRRQIIIRLNGNNIVTDIKMAVTDAAVGTVHAIGAAPRYCVAGDFFQVYVLQASGGALNSVASATNSMPQFGVWMVP